MRKPEGVAISGLPSPFLRFPFFTLSSILTYQTGRKGGESGPTLICRSPGDHRFRSNMPGLPGCPKDHLGFGDLLGQVLNCSIGHAGGHAGLDTGRQKPFGCPPGTQNTQLGGHGNKLEVVLVLGKVFHHLGDPYPPHACRPFILLGTGHLAGVASRAEFIVYQ